MKSNLYYVHDPMCSWCWGFTESFNNLLAALPAEINIIRLLGGLAPDTESVMPETMQQNIQNNWLRIEDSIAGVKFNFDFWENNIPRRSTYPACRAVIAARLQGEKYDVLMTKAIQRAYYQEARNPSDNITLIELAIELGLEKDKFEKDLNSTNVENELQQEISLARDLFVESYPNLVLVTEDNINSIKLDYINSNSMLRTINGYLVNNIQ